jgi:predicted glycosyltransferase
MPELAVNPEVKPVAGARLARSASAKHSQNRRIWIDLDNSPHVPFFAPIIEELEKSGYSVIVTVRDCFQVCELAELLHLEYRRVGRHYGKNTFWKLTGLCWRALQLLPGMLRDKPQMALSHGSRSQLVVANLLRIPSVTVADYEFAKLWTLVHPTWVITPEIIPSERMGCSKDRILKYPGIKEDVYIPRFKPDSSIFSSFGLKPSTDLIVVIRPPATEAHYHRPESDELFTAVLNFLGNEPQVKMVLLPRNEHQAAVIRSTWKILVANGKILIPSRVTDGLNLIWHSDLVISGGGTMNREAAALGVPVYSIFRGEIGAVDRYLVSTGRLTLIERPEDVAKKLLLTKRDRSYMTDTKQRGALKVIVEHLGRILSLTN